MRAGAGKYKLRARVVKYKFGTGAVKYKLGSGPGAGKHKYPTLKTSSEEVIVMHYEKMKAKYTKEDV